MKKTSLLFTLILIFSVPWQNIITFEPMGTFSRLLGFIAIGVAFTTILVNRRLHEPSLVLILMLLFVVWSFLSYLWSINPPATLGRVITLVQLLAMAWLIWEYCDTNKTHLTMIQAYILGCLVSITDMYMTFFTGSSGEYRIVATGFNPNWLAITLATSIPLAWYLMYSLDNKILRWFNLAYIPICIFAIILTASRGGFVSMLVGISVIPLTIFYIEKRIRTVVILSGTLFLAVIALNLQDLYPKIERNVERLGGTQTAILEGRLNYREIIWQAGWQVFKQNPVLGVGARGFRESVVENVVISRQVAPHNAYLSILVDTGIIGFLLFIAIMYLALAPNLSIPPPDRLVWIALLATIAIGMIPANIEANKTTWCILAILSANRSFVLRKSKIILIKQK
jgi:O-antigen ligase